MSEYKLYKLEVEK